MDFDKMMNDIKKTETTGDYIKKACVEVVTIKGYKMSPKEHTGCPYIEVTFETTDASKSTNNTRLYLVREGDSPDTIEFKNKRIKELLENAGADFSLKGEQVLKSAVSKKVKALFKSVEYIGYNKDNFNQPEIRTKIEYSFSAKADAEINGNQSYLFSALKEADRKKFEGELAKWNRDNPSTSNAPVETKSATQELLDEGDFPVEDDGLAF
jgi:hypothetical protein